MWYLIAVIILLVVLVGVLWLELFDNRGTITGLGRERDRYKIEAANLQIKYTLLHTSYEELVHRLQDMARRRHKKIEHPTIEA